MDERYWMPTRIDDPPMFLLWDIDLVIVFVLSLSMGIATGFFTLSIVLGFLLAWAFSRSKGGKHPHFLKHLAWWYLPIDLIVLRRSPPSGVRAFLG